MEATAEPDLYVLSSARSAKQADSHLTSADIRILIITDSVFATKTASALLASGVRNLEKVL